MRGEEGRCDPGEENEMRENGVGGGIYYRRETQGRERRLLFCFAERGRQLLENER